MRRSRCRSSLRYALYGAVFCLVLLWGDFDGRAVHLLPVLAGLPHTFLQMTRTTCSHSWLSMLASSHRRPARTPIDLKNAEAVPTKWPALPIPAFPRSLIAKAKCVVVVPGVKKARARRRRPVRPRLSRVSQGRLAAGARRAVIRIEGGSFGFQIGGSDTDVILLVMNDRGVDRLLSSRFTVGADAAVAAGPLGRQASAQTDATMMAEMLAWSRSRGVLCGHLVTGLDAARGQLARTRSSTARRLPNREIVKGKTAVPRAPQVSSRRWGSTSGLLPDVQQLDVEDEHALRLGGARRVRNRS